MKGVADVASDELMELVFLAIDHATDSVRQGGPLIPFTVTVSNGERQLRRFGAERLEDGLAQARRSVDQEKASLAAYAIAHDGYVTVQGERSDAVFVEAGEAGEEHAAVFGQRYRPKRRLKKFEAVGNVAHVGNEPNRLA